MTDSLPVDRALPFGTRRLFVAASVVVVAGVSIAWLFRTDILGWLLAPSVALWFSRCLPSIGDDSINMFDIYIRMCLAFGILPLYVPTSIIVSAALDRTGLGSRLRGFVSLLSGFAILAATIWVGSRLLDVLSEQRAASAHSCHVASMVEWHVDTLLQGLVAMALPVQGIVVAVFRPRVWLDWATLRYLSVSFLLVPALCSFALGFGELGVRLATAAAMVGCFLLAIAVAKLSIRVSPAPETTPR